MMIMTQLAYDDNDTDKHRNAYVNNQDISKCNTVGKYNTIHQFLMMGTKTVSDKMDINPTLPEPIIRERVCSIQSLQKLQIIFN